MKFGVLYDFRNPSQPDYFTPWPEFYGGGLEHISWSMHRKSQRISRAGENICDGRRNTFNGDQGRHDVATVGRIHAEFHRTSCTSGL